MSKPKSKGAATTVEDVLKAIQDYFSDASCPKEETSAGLDQIIAECESMKDSL